MVRVAILVLTVCVAAMAAPQGPEARLIRQRNENDGLGEYRNTIELDDGTIISEAGALKNVGGQDVVVAAGQYSFVAPDGQVHWVTWTADENGFHPIVGTGPGGIGAGGDAQIDPNALKSLVGK